MKYKIHPVAEMFPLLPHDSREYKTLLNSISGIGQIEPIVIDGDVLIDGRNRLAVCEGLRIEPRAIQWSELEKSGNEFCTIAEWIFAKNISRRHLSEDQRVIIAAEFNVWIMAREAEEQKEAAQFKVGQSANPRGRAGKEPVNTDSSSPVPRDTKAMHARSTVGRVAAAAKVSQHKSGQAVAVIKAAKEGVIDPSVVEMLKSGELKLTAARKQISKKKPEPEALNVRFEKWWPKCLEKKFTQSEMNQVKEWIKHSL